MSDEFISPSNHTSNEPDEENINIFDVIRNLMENTEESAALEFQQEAKKRFAKLCQLALDAKVRLFCNMNILKYHIKKGRTDLRLCKLSLRIRRQCWHDLRNIEKEMSEFKFFIGLTEEEMCAKSKIYNNLTNLFVETQPVLNEWLQATVTLIVNNILLEWMRRKQIGVQEAGSNK